MFVTNARLKSRNGEKMYTVGNSFLNETNCNHDFSCLYEGNCGNNDMCEVEYERGEYFLILNENKEIKCNNIFSYGLSDKHICLYPTNYAIYRNYRK